MIKNLNLVVTEDGEGKVQVLHVGTDRGEALKVFEKALADTTLECVVHIRNPPASRRKYPAKALRYREERLATGNDSEAETGDKKPGKKPSKNKAKKAAKEPEKEPEKVD